MYVTEDFEVLIVLRRVANVAIKTNETTERLKTNIKKLLEEFNYTLRKLELKKI